LRHSVYKLIGCDTDSDSFDGVAAVKYTGSDVTDEAIHPVSCDVKSSSTRATVVVDVQWSDLTSAHRVAILRRFAEHLQLPVSLISLLPAENAIEVGRYKRRFLSKQVNDLCSQSLMSFFHLDFLKFRIGIAQSYDLK